MATGLLNSAGTDFDNLFAQGTGTQLFSIYTSSGVDVGQRYLPASSGTAGDACGFLSYSPGADIGPKLCKYGTNTPAYTKQVLSGSGTFTVPAGVTKLKVTMSGGGGGGGDGTYTSQSGGAGAAGGAGGRGGWHSETINVAAGMQFSYSVGGGGARATAGGNTVFGGWTCTGGAAGTRGVIQTVTVGKETEYTGVNGTKGADGTPSSGNGAQGGSGGAAMSGTAGYGHAGSAGWLWVEYGEGIQ